MRSNWGHASWEASGLSLFIVLAQLDICPITSWWDICPCCGLRRGRFDREADDAGVALAKNEQGSGIGSLSRALGRALVRGMPVLLTCLSVVGTAAMIWVGGGIIVHGLEEYGLPSIDRAIDTAAEAAAHAIPPVARVAEWIVSAVGSGFVGLLIGAMLIPVTEYGLAPAWKLLKNI